MKFPRQIDLNEFIGHQTILYGETNTKKTYYTARFVQFLLNVKKFNPKDISILDFAPKLFKYYNIKIGGKIDDYYPQSIKCNNITFKGDIIPPRLRASNKKELFENACKNYKKTHDILKIYHENPTSILIINDISIYLHIGSKKLLLDAIMKANTFFGNLYYGSSITRDFASLFSLKEKRVVESLIKKIENSYSTDQV